MEEEIRIGLALIVGDSEESNGILRHVLELEGWRVRVARNGDDALHAGAQESPDVVITDIDLPGMSGAELAQALRKGRVHLPILALTWTAREPGDDGSFDGVLRKPVSLQALRRWLADQRLRGSPGA